MGRGQNTGDLLNQFKETGRDGKIFEQESDVIGFSCWEDACAEPTGERRSGVQSARGGGGLYQFSSWSSSCLRFGLEGRR